MTVCQPQLPGLLQPWKHSEKRFAPKQEARDVWPKEEPEGQSPLAGPPKGATPGGQSRGFRGGQSAGLGSRQQRSLAGVIDPIISLSEALVQTVWSWRPDLHRQPPVYKTGALLLSYASVFTKLMRRRTYPPALLIPQEAGPVARLTYFLEPAVGAAPTPPVYRTGIQSC